MIGSSAYPVMTMADKVVVIVKRGSKEVVAFESTIDFRIVLFECFGLQLLVLEVLRCSNVFQYFANDTHLEDESAE